MPRKKTAVKSRAEKRKATEDMPKAIPSDGTSDLSTRELTIPDSVLERRLHWSQLVVYLNTETSTYIPGLITHEPMYPEYDATGQLWFKVKALLFDGNNTAVTVRITSEHMTQFTREAVTNPNPRIPDWRDMTVVLPYDTGDAYPAEQIDSIIYEVANPTPSVDCKILTFDRPPKVRWIRLRKREIQEYFRKLWHK